MINSFRKMNKIQVKIINNKFYNNMKKMIIWKQMKKKKNKTNQNLMNKFKKFFKKNFSTSLAICFLMIVLKKK